MEKTAFQISKLISQHTFFKLNRFSLSRRPIVQALLLFDFLIRTKLIRYFNHLAMNERSRVASSRIDWNFCTYDGRSSIVVDKCLFVHLSMCDWYVISAMELRDYLRVQLSATVNAVFISSRIGVYYGSRWGLTWLRLNVDLKMRMIALYSRNFSRDRRAKGNESSGNSTPTAYPRTDCIGGNIFKGRLSLQFP